MTDLSQHPPNGLRRQRQAAGVRTAELARRVGTTRQQIFRLETGQRKLTLEWAMKIAKALDVDPRDLLFPELGPHRPPQPRDKHGRFSKAANDHARQQFGLALEEMEAAS